MNAMPFKDLIFLFIAEYFCQESIYSYVTERRRRV
jgi:hypothetical protein